MFSGHRFPRHSREQRRLARIAVFAAIPLALALIGGAVYAADHGSATIKTAAANPTSAPSAGAAAVASASPPAAAAPAAANMDCQLVVPANALSAQGLATPYQLEGPAGMPSPQQSGCTMANAANNGAFVQATILNPATGQLSTYEPLVITKGTTPAVKPVVPQLPAGAVVTVDVGFNANNLTLTGATATALAQAHAVNGLPGSVFGEVSFLNGVAFFQAANQDIRQGLLKVAATGTTAAGQACPTTRSFTMIDQDQSDNVTTQYLLNGNGQTAQDNAANTAAVAGAMTINNGSDNALLNGFLDPVLGCKSDTAPDLSNGGRPGTSQALDELSAAANQRAPVALVPVNDPMTLVNNAFSVTKTNTYRTSVDQQPLSAFTSTGANAAMYCQDMLNIQTPFLAGNKAALQNGQTPVPAVGNNLFTFMANRLSMSFTNLNCQNFGLKNTVQVTLDGNGAATAATLNTAQQTAKTGTGTGTNPVPGTRRNHGQSTAMHGMVPSNQSP